MALESFALLTADGDHAQADHLFAGKAGDLVAVAGVLDVVHSANRRLHAVPALARRFCDGAAYPLPAVRLAKAECRVLVDAITDFGQSMPKTTAARKLAGLLASPVCVY
ncbi:hypothetical protein R20233_04893 [Ralstonia sp. LMG 32965]|uniref:hypothetical protein n=1 Tax=Ralstonia flatus TaxID=3058601 RepID=UPI0028F59F65|nr:hypothetical protein [Ralstonia sp. LMG 32965]CAJ0903142.1 hypothetical protein R20233_04893 [Ralstonia sp. LMG 32965]